MTTPGTLHLVVPCSNESARITSFLPGLCRSLDAEGGCHVLVVEDGSGEDEQKKMSAIVEGLRVDHPCLRSALLLPRNLGKGGAVHAGWSANQGSEWVGFVDADGAIPAYEVVRLLQSARETGVAGGAIFSSRVMMLGRTVQRHLHRHLMGRVFATVVSILLRVPVYDSQCGFKLMPARAFEIIEPGLNTNGFAFDVELLVALLDSGCAVREFPIDWHDVPGGKVRLLQDSCRMFGEVIRIRQRRGKRAEKSRE